MADQASAFTPDVEAAAQRIRDLSDQILEMSKKNGLSWLEAYEKALEGMLKLQQQAAAGSQVEWLNTLATTNAEFVRDWSKVYTDALRGQLAK
jgi:hypothetical protein